MNNKAHAESINKLQDKLNCLIHPEWVKQDFDFRAAAMLEMSEAYDSTPWKWWKAMELDKQNLEVELVDTFHFLLSATIIEFGKEGSLAILLSLPEEHPVTKSFFYIDDDIKTYQQEMKHFIAATVTSGMKDLWDRWSFLWLALGKTWDDITYTYLIKNILNIFRQENGYKEGTYIKDWIGADGKRYEDNVIAWEIAETLSFDAGFEYNLKEALTSTYLVTKQAA